MTNIIENIRVQVRNVIKNALLSAVKKGELPEADIDEIAVETPKEKEHGEFSTNIAMQLARQVKKAPLQTAAILIANMDFSGTYIKEAVSAGPGFINFHLKKSK
jgi:arginyl-tRNA synthetase